VPADGPADGPGAGGLQSQLIHGTCLVIGACGVLIMGPPGSGKSDLALRLIDQPGRGTGDEAMAARLVADDQVVITARGNRLNAAAPPQLAGLIEVRGLGIVRTECARQVDVDLVVRLADATNIERLPPGDQDGDQARVVLVNIELPEIAIDPAAASAPARVRAALVEILRHVPEIAR
jgi:HPr kinase/phosphorylase